jgi:hypothetical protein
MKNKTKLYNITDITLEKFDDIMHNLSIEFEEYFIKPYVAWDNKTPIVFHIMDKNNLERISNNSFKTPKEAIAWIKNTKKKMKNFKAFHCYYYPEHRIKIIKVTSVVEDGSRFNATIPGKNNRIKIYKGTHLYAMSQKNKEIVKKIIEIEEKIIELKKENTKLRDSLEIIDTRKILKELDIVA